MQNEVECNIRKFILGGKAEFTIFQEPNIQATYRVTQSKDGKIWFIYVTGHYQGYIRKEDILRIKLGNRTPIVYLDEKALHALLWVLKHGDDLPDKVHILHKGKCAVCGKPLTDAISLKYGVGPTCRERIGITVDKG